MEGRHIYKTEMIIKNNNIENHYCSCPSSEGGMSFCKHLAGIVYYLKDNEILELEDSPKEEHKIDLSLSSDEILKEFRLRINSLVDRYTGEINCYNSSKYVDIIIEYKEYIDNLLNNNKIKDAYNLVTEMLEVLEHIYVCSENDYCEGKEKLYYYIKSIMSDYNYKDEIINYLEEEYKNKEITDSGMDVLDILINDVSTLEEANKMINKALFNQIAVFFLFPLLLAIIHSIFGIEFANYILKTIGTELLLSSIILTAVFLVVIYGGYFLVTYYCSKNIIKERN